jgi:hypothetical protein
LPCDHIVTYGLLATADDDAVFCANGQPEPPISFDEALEVMLGMRGDEWVERHMGLLESQSEWIVHIGFAD